LSGFAKEVNFPKIGVSELQKMKQCNKKPAFQRVFRFSFYKIA